MNDFAKTAAAVILAAGLATAAYVTAPRAVTDAAFSDQGQVFFPEFKDPTVAKSLEVISYDEATATLTPFKVQFDGQRWVIPSHHNYPADAESNMSGAASAFIGLKKDEVVTDKASEHESLGVLAPDDDKAPLTGRGTRVTLRDASGAALADMIIGKPVVRTSVGGKTYVRVPGKNRVYAVDFQKHITTAFADWVQTDVLKVGSAQVVGLNIDRYQIDEQAQTKKTTERLSITNIKPPPNPPQTDPNAPPPPPPARWTFTCEPGGPPGDQEKVQDAPVEEAVNTLRTMRILGVRTKPDKLVKYFSADPSTATTQLNQLDLMGLANKGFYVAQGGQFLANEGEMDVKCDDGVVYKMFFGELLVASGEALTAGDEGVGAAKTPEAKPGETPKADQPKKDDKAKGTEARYVLVTAKFDESLLGPPPVAPTAPTPPPGYDPNAKPAEAKPGEAGAPAPAPTPDAPEVAAYKVSKAKYDADQAKYLQEANARNARVESGKTRAESLRKSLANWYYVIDAASFQKIRPTRQQLVTPPAPPPAPPAPVGAPGAISPPVQPASIEPAPSGGE